MPNSMVQSVDVGGCSHLHLYHLGRLSSLRRCSSWCVTHDPERREVAPRLMLLLLLCAALLVGWGGGSGDLESDFKLVVFKIGNA